MVSTAYRDDRRRRCMEYIRRAGVAAGLDGAKKLAKTEGFRAVTSAWVGAYGALLTLGFSPPEPAKHEGDDDE